MNWKHILKPNVRKIILFIFLTFVGVLIILDSMFGGYHAIPQSLIDLLAIVFLLPVYLMMLTHIYDVSFDLILSVAYWYLLSSVLIWLYDKFRKRK